MCYFNGTFVYVSSVTHLKQFQADRSDSDSVEGQNDMLHESSINVDLELHCGHVCMQES